MKWSTIDFNQILTDEELFNSSYTSFRDIKQVEPLWGFDYLDYGKISKEIADNVLGENSFTEKTLDTMQRKLWESDYVENMLDIYLESFEHNLGDVEVRNLEYVESFFGFRESYLLDKGYLDENKELTEDGFDFMGNFSAYFSNCVCEILSCTVDSKIVGWMKNMSENDPYVNNDDAYPDGYLEESF